MRLRKSIRLKFVVSFLGISVLPILALFIFTFKSNSQFYQNQISIASNNDMKAITANINEKLKNLAGLLDSLISSEYENTNLMLSISSQEGKHEQPTSIQRLFNYRRFEYVTNNLIRNNEYAEGVYLFTESGYTYSFMKNRELNLEKNYKESSWYRSLWENDKFQVIDIYEPRNIPSEKKIVLARYFTDLKGTNKGILAVVCNDAIFEKISDDSMPWKKNFVMNSQNEIVYGDANNIDLNDKELKEIHSNESGFITRGRKSNSYIYGKILANDWKIVSEISFGSLDQLYIKNTKYLAWLIVIILLLVYILLLIAERIFIKPIINLKDVMNQTSSINLHFENALKKRTDEIGSLYRSFEKMIKEINKLIQEKYVNEINSLNLKLKSLMGQINAHFIFNTLENINSLAEIENNKQIVMMSKSLGDMLRYSIEYETNEESLIKEIDHIKQYINIQEIRFGNQIFLEVEIEGGLDDTRVLKFMLQPIIENAIEHGLINEKSPWIIKIKAFKDNGDLIISIQDNGIGISKKELEKVRHRINLSEHINTNTIALHNIHKRIQLLYTEKYGLKIDSKINNGVKITINLPLDYMDRKGS